MSDATVDMTFIYCPYCRASWMTHHAPVTAARYHRANWHPTNPPKLKARLGRYRFGRGWAYDDGRWVERWTGGRADD
jgi:hypothetical protein